MKDYNPSDWYWIVNDSKIQVYSSLIGDYVSMDNPVFVAWSADGTLPSKIVSEGELSEVLAPYNIRPVAASVLEGYQDAQARRLTLEVVAKVLFNLVNEVRVLKGQQQITAQQFRTYIKGLM